MTNRNGNIFEEKLSEGKYEELFESLPQGFCIIQMIFDEEEKPIDYRFLKVNNSFEDQTGIRQAEGKTIREIAPSLEEYWFEIYGRVAKTGESVQFENYARELNQRYFNVFASSFGDVENHQVAILFSDISKEKQAKDAFKESEKKLDTILEILPVGVFIANRYGEFERGNKATRDLWGIPPETKSWEDYADWVGWWPDTGERIKADEWAMAKALKEGTSTRGELVKNSPFGSDEHRYYINNVVPLRNEKNEIVGGVAAMLDVTDRIKVEKALRKSEEQYHTALKHSPILFAKVDTNLRYEWVFNPHVDFAPEHFIGKRDDELDSGPGIEALIELKQNVLNEGKQKRREITFSRADGEHTYDITATPLLNEQDEIQSIVTASLDITERKRAEEALRESEERFRELAQNVNSIFWIHTWPEQEQLYLSPAFEKITGLDRDKLIEGGLKAWLEIIHFEDRQRVLKAYQQQAEYGTFDEQYRIMRPDGSICWLYDRSFPIRNKEGEIYRVAGIAEDITQQKRQEQKLKRMNEKLEQRVEERTAKLKRYQFKLQSLVHELNNAEENERQRLASELHDNIGQLLAMCKMNLKVLEKKGESEQFYSEINQINELINESIKYTRKLMSELQPPPSIQEDLMTALKWIAEKMQRHGLEVEIKDGDKRKPLIENNRRIIIQIVRELLFNVAKHAETTKAWVTIYRPDGFIKIEVEDQGKGFDTSQLNSSFVTDGEFGLFNIQERLNLLGGKFTIKSEPGSGTKAVATIPSTGNPDHTDIEPFSFESSISISESESTTSEIKVMIVDDHPMMRKGIARIINDEKDMTVALDAGNAEEAIETLAEMQPDVVILDINLPGMNGIDAAKIIRKAYPEIAIIGLSFQNDSNIISKMQKAGASGFVSKEEAPESLCQTIRDVVR